MLVKMEILLVFWFSTRIIWPLKQDYKPIIISNRRTSRGIDYTDSEIVEVHVEHGKRQFSISGLRGKRNGRQRKNGKTRKQKGRHLIDE